MSHQNICIGNKGSEEGVGLHEQFLMMNQLLIVYILIRQLLMNSDIMCTCIATSNTLVCMLSYPMHITECLQLGGIVWSSKLVDDWHESYYRHAGVDSSMIILDSQTRQQMTLHFKLSLQCNDLPITGFVQAYSKEKEKVATYILVQWAMIAQDSMHVHIS